MTASCVVEVMPGGMTDPCRACRSAAASVDRFDDRRPGRNLSIEMAIDGQLAGKAARGIDFS